MSVTTDAVLITLKGDETAVQELNDKLYMLDTERHQEFGLLESDAAGGTKFPSLQVYQACFNHVMDSDITDSLRSVTWRFPKSVLLYLDSELEGLSLHDVNGEIKSEGIYY